jgi:3',5'-cyclic AMP phosphodiesterase CpdA
MEAQGKGGADDLGRETLVRCSQYGVWSKKTLPVLLLILLAASPSFSAQNQQIAQKLVDLAGVRGKLTFIVMGDNRSGDDIYRRIVSLAMDRKPEFVVNTGDMIVTPGNKQEWAKFWEMSKPIDVPYFLTVGNHDAHPKVPLSEKTYKQEVDLPGNELYYSFVAGHSLFIILDSCMDNQEKRIIGEQFKWLEAVLVNSTQKHKFVFLHHPLFTDLGKGHHAHESLDKYPESRDRLAALFAKCKVDAVFAGHEHYYEKRTVDNVLYIITGGGGAPVYDKDEYGGFHHFVQVLVDGDKVSAEVVDVNGKLRDKF